MTLLTSLLILLIASRILGQIFERLGQPAMIGEICAGIFLGPSILGLIQISPALTGISELAIFLIIFSAGLEMDFRAILKAFRGPGILISILGFVLPFISGVLLGFAFQYSPIISIFLGLCIAITALPVTLRILSSFNALNSRIAQYTVSAAIANDVLAFLILGIILNLAEDSSAFYKSTTYAVQTILTTALKLLFFMGLILLVNKAVEYLQTRWNSPGYFTEKIISLSGNEALFGLTVVFALIFGSLAEIFGFHFTIGAFFGALLLNRELFLPKRFLELKNISDSVTSGFLAPIFFAYLGLEFQLFSLGSLPFILSLLFISITTKILAGVIGGRLIGLGPREALGVGIILNGRGVIELIIAGIAYERGLINTELFSSLVLMGIVTTAMTPILYRRFVQIKKSPFDE